MSATRPANTEMKLGAPSATAFVTVSTCEGSMRAVTLTCTPSSDSSRTRSAVETPSVFVTGILMKTLGPHVAITRAWRRISGSSSAKTSNEIGRSGTISSTR